MAKKMHEFGGFEKEPPQPHGPRMRGKTLVHSHSAKRTYKISAGKKASKKTSI